MKIEHGIWTQRLRLLRLVAGLLMLVGFVSCAPFSSECRRQIRSFILSVLTRAEMAGQALVVAQAGILARRRGLRFDPAPLLAAHGQSGADTSSDDVSLPTLAELRQRLIALRAVLKNLPQRGLRLLRRIFWIQADGQNFDPSFCLQPTLYALQLTTLPIERPPIRKSVTSAAVQYPSFPQRAGGDGHCANVMVA